jgi:hypothetical protein
VPSRPENSGGSWELGSKKKFGLLEYFEESALLGDNYSLWINGKMVSKFWKISF